MVWTWFSCKDLPSRLRCGPASGDHSRVLPTSNRIAFAQILALLVSGETAVSLVAFFSLLAFSAMLPPPLHLVHDRSRPSLNLRRGPRVSACIILAYSPSPRHGQCQCQFTSIVFAPSPLTFSLPSPPPLFALGGPALSSDLVWPYLAVVTRSPPARPGPRESPVLLTSRPPMLPSLQPPFLPTLSTLISAPHAHPSQVLCPDPPPPLVCIDASVAALSKPRLISSALCVRLTAFCFRARGGEGDTEGESPLQCH